MKSCKELNDQKNEKISKIKNLEESKNVILDKINDGNHPGTYIKQFEDLRTQIELEKGLLERLLIDIRVAKIYELLAGKDNEFEDLNDENKRNFLKSILEVEKKLPDLLKDRIREELTKLDRTRRPIY